MMLGSPLLITKSIYWALTLKNWEEHLGKKKKKKKKSYLVVLHGPPLICENWKKVFTVQKYTAPNFQNPPPPQSFFFFFPFENFGLLEIFFKLLLLSTCLHFNTCLNLYKEIFW